MAKICSKCGKPIVEGSICPCRKAKRGASAGAEKNTGYVQGLLRLCVQYFRDPVATARQCGERREFVNGTILMGATVLLSALGTLIFSLTRLVGTVYPDFSSAAMAWFSCGILTPVLIYGLTFGALYLLTMIVGMRVDFFSVLAVVGVHSIFPGAFLGLSAILAPFSPYVFEIFGLFAMVAWIVTFLTSVFQNFHMKMSVISMGLLLLIFAGACYLLLHMTTWLLFDGSNASFAAMLAAMG